MGFFVCGMMDRFGYEKKPQLTIPMMDSNQTVEEFIIEHFITFEELSRELGYNVTSASIKSWLRGKYRPPEEFEEVCKTNKEKLIQYSDWKLREGVFENYTKRKPQGFWKIKKTHRYALDWLCQKENWDFPYGLYELKNEIMDKHNINGLSNYYSRSPVRMVTSILPEYDWKIWKFQMTPMAHWKSDEHKKEYLRSFEKLKGIKTPEDWYKIKLLEFYEFLNSTSKCNSRTGCERSGAAVGFALFSPSNKRRTNETLQPTHAKTKIHNIFDA